MMEKAIVCASESQLKSYLVGDLDDELYNETAAHLVGCRACQETVVKVGESAGAIVPADLDSLASACYDREAGCRAAVQRIEAIQLDQRFAVPRDLHEDDALARVGNEQPTTLGPYEIVEQLGQGGMGVVYRAFHTKLKREVALKILRPGRAGSEQAIARFAREMEAVGRLDHPNIVRATDADQRDGYHFLVMEYIQGLDLAQLVDRHGPLEVGDACELICQAAKGLAYANGRGLVHRDIKPSNLMLAKTDSPQSERPVVTKVLDMGMALLRDGKPLTGTGEVLGTPDYLAPEQWENACDVDTRTDVYGLGCSLVFLLLGRPPFDHDKISSLPSKMRAHLQETIPLVHELRSDVPETLSKIIQQAMAKRPSDRFSDPAQLAAALAPFTHCARLDQLIVLIEPEAFCSLSTNAASMRRTVAVEGAAKADPLDTQPVRNALRFGRLGATLCGIFVVASIVIGLVVFRPDVSRRRLAAPLVSGPASDAVAVPVRVEQFRVVHFRYDDQEQVQRRIGDVREQVEAVRAEDEARVEFELSRPAYCYLLALNPNGSVQLCFPSEGSAPSPCERISWPQVSTKFFGFTDGVGQQAFVLLASDRPLPRWPTILSGLPADFWFGGSGNGVWSFDGSELRQLFPDDEKPRGDLVERDSTRIKTACQLLADRPDITVVRAIAFPIHERVK